MYKEGTEMAILILAFWAIGIRERGVTFVK